MTFWEVRMTFRQVHHSYSLPRGRPKLGFYLFTPCLHLLWEMVKTIAGRVKNTNCIFKLDTIIPTLHKAILLTLFDIFGGDMVETQGTEYN